VLVNRIDKPKLTVAVDGSLYRFHPHFHRLMMKMTASLIKPNIDVSFPSIMFILLWLFVCTYCWTTAVASRIT